MNISVKEEKSQVVIESTVPVEEFAEYRKKVLEILGKDIQLEGFRKGAAPTELVAQEIGEQKVLLEAANRAVGVGYEQAIKENGLHVIGNPEVQILKLAAGNPLEFRIQVAVLPAIQLPDYKKIAASIARKEVTVEDKEIEQTLEWLRNSRKEKGKEAPEMTDELAASLGEFKNVAALKVSIKEGVLQEKNVQETQRLRQEVVEKIAEKTKIEIPEVLLERERIAMLANMKEGVKRTLKLDFPEYLTKIKKTEKEITETIAKDAEKRVKGFLVLREIAQVENIEATPEELEAEVAKAIAQYSTPEKAEKEVDQERLKEYATGAIKNEKTFQFLEQLTI